MLVIASALHYMKKVKRSEVCNNVSLLAMYNIRVLILQSHDNESLSLWLELFGCLARIADW